MADDKISDREIVSGAVGNYCIHTGHPTADGRCEDCERVVDEVLSSLAASGRGIVSREQPVEVLQAGALAGMKADRTQIYWEAVADRVWTAMFDASLTKD